MHRRRVYISLLMTCAFLGAEAGYSEVVGEGLNQHVHGFSLPFNACSKCQSAARDSFQNSSKESDTTTVLQDRVQDIFERK